jgi:hypothetical protein
MYTYIHTYINKYIYIYVCIYKPAQWEMNVSPCAVQATAPGVAGGIAGGIRRTSVSTA